MRIPRIFIIARNNPYYRNYDNRRCSAARENRERLRLF